ncbi:hypothetical protein ABAC460_07310 [Asticcacaulis sp. AC460]|uniref:DUF6691 family protein n=1 Tax=Asticcacaulis sp. AC460 TaxID=1282360 RepID=UPI0003C3F78E|nr:DUF6691 family protein [Asticcacaulis sp. AC460]ESQ91093.1 hypothetical protein ABAC460_07310 [Asticcacaulis sp. AC460]
MKIADIVLPLGFGLLFGLGLIVSGMIDTANVLGFLDIAGDWRPALALVMGGAVAVALPLFQWTRRRGKAFNGAEPESPPARIDRRLIVGAGIFGIGWGLSGICPGPGIVWLGLGIDQVWPFLVAVAAGAWLADRLPQRR